MEGNKGLQILKVRLQSLESQFSSLERRLREVKHRPRPSLSRVFAEPERCLGGRLCEAKRPAGAIIVDRVAWIDV